MATSCLQFHVTIVEPVEPKRSAPRRSMKVRNLLCVHRLSTLHDFSSPCCRLYLDRNRIVAMNALIGVTRLPVTVSSDNFSVLKYVTLHWLLNNNFTVRNAQNIHRLLLTDISDWKDESEFSFKFKEYTDMKLRFLNVFRPFLIIQTFFPKGGMAILVHVEKVPTFLSQRQIDLEDETSILKLYHHFGREFYEKIFQPIIKAGLPIPDESFMHS